MQYKLIHDESHAEQASGYKYLIAKVYDAVDREVGQVKMEVGERGGKATISVTISGDLKPAENEVSRDGIPSIAVLDNNIS